MAQHPPVEINITFEAHSIDPVAENYDIVVHIAQPDEKITTVDIQFLVLDYLLYAAPAYLDRR